MDKEIIRAYYEKHEPELEDAYLNNDPEYQKREAELKAALQNLESFMQNLGHEAWLKFDRVLTAHNQCEAYGLQAMYIKGALDACRIFCPGREGDGYGRN